MKRHQHQHFSSLRFAAGFAMVGWMVVATGWATADDGLDRLMKRAALTKNEKASGPAAESKRTTDAPATHPTCSSVACLIPSTIEAADRARRTSHNAQDGFNFSDPSEFTLRGQTVTDVVYPTPLAYGKQIYGVPQNNPTSGMNSPGCTSECTSGCTSGCASGCTGGCTPGNNAWNPNAHRDEYVFDGHDRGEKVHVDQSWNVHGLQTEDTIGHFDTLNGNRVVTPSNRVAIYAPRFGAVRKVDGVFGAKFNQPVLAYEEKMPIAQADGKDGATTTKQHLALTRFAGSKRASGFIDRTRGVVSDTVTHLFGARNSFKAFEDLSLMRIGKWSNAESARLALGIQSALVWEDDLGLQVVTKKISPIIVRDVKTLEAMVSIKAEDGADMLRVTKIASKIAARTGEHVEFTIRFDNLSNEKIGNVTIIDNLTRRLEYVEDSAESSLKSDFISKRNDGGSLMLRWEIIEPMEPHTGGIIRFRCRVR